jgi:hypothetical protein
MRKKLLLIVLITIFSSITISGAYDTDNVHPLINDNALLQSNVNNYFKTQLGFVNGIKEVFRNKRITEWIKEGAKLEDETVCRSRDHFYDPLKPWDSAGLNNIAVNTFCFSIGEDFSVDSSIIWAQKSPASSVTKNYWSWPKARNYYYKALTSTTKDDREQNFAYTFRALGQVTHLISDSSVPAHVRNDIHVFPLTIPGIGMDVGGETYESWARKNFSALDYTAKKVDQSIFNQAVTNSSALVPISALWDQNKYTGTNPSTTWTTNPSISGFGLAEYTNANFFSEDTIFKDYPHPKKENTTARLVEQTAKDGKKDEVWYIQGYTSERLAAYSYLNKWLLPDKWEYNLDGYVYEDYASQLIPRAVGYSAGLLNYFFRGDIEMVPDSTTGSGYVIVNNTDEDMNGTFELYYDNNSDERIRINGWSLSIAKKSSGNNRSINITFTKPSDMKEDGKYMLVFRGKLGNEENAVAGRSVDLKGGEYVFLVSAYDRSKAVFKIKTTNNQYQLIPISKNIAITFADAPSTLLTVQSHPNKKEHVVALPWYRYDYSGNLVTTYEPNIAKYGKKIPYLDYLGYTHYVTVGFPQSYIPKNFNDDKSSYIWDAGFTYGEWTYTKVGNYYTSRLASYIHGRRPFSMVDDKLVVKNINIRKNDDYTYYGDDYSGPFHIQYKDETGNWVRGTDLSTNGGEDSHSYQNFGIECETVYPPSAFWYYGQRYPYRDDKICEAIITPGETSVFPIPINYLAILDENKTVNIITARSTVSTVSIGNAAVVEDHYTLTDEWSCYEGGTDTVNITSDNSYYYIEAKTTLTTDTNEKLVIGGIVLEEFQSNNIEHSSEFRGLGNRGTASESNSSSCRTSHIISRSGHSTQSFTGFTKSYGSNRNGKNIGRVLDYDHMDGDNYLIIFYEYKENNSKRGGTDTLNEEEAQRIGVNEEILSYPELWIGTNYYYDIELTTKYRLAYKINDAIEKMDIDISNTEIDQGGGIVQYTGQRITGLSCQINNSNMVYTYIIERYDNGNWVFDRRITGIINISDKSLPVGHRQEFDLDFSGTDFDPKSLAAIGVHAD